MNLFGEQINELKRRFAEQHPRLASQFPVYFLTVLVRKRNPDDTLQLNGAMQEKFSRAAHHFIRDDDSIDVAGMTADEFRSLVMEFVVQCIDYAISSSGELESDSGKLREFLESFTRALNHQLGDDGSSTDNKPMSDIANGMGTAKQQVIGVVGSILGKSGSRITKNNVTREEDPYGYIETWIDISDEDAYAMLLHDLLISYFHTQQFFQRLRRTTKQLGGTFGRIVALANPKSDSLVYSLFGEADLVAAINIQYPGRIQRFAGHLEGGFDILINTAIAVANGLACYFEDSEDPLYDEDLIYEGEIPFDYFDSATPDLVVGVIPHRDRIRPNKLASRFNYGRGSTRSEVAYLEYVQSLLGDSGRAVIGISNHFLDSSEGRTLRRTLTENDLLEKVYAIPADPKSMGSVNSAVIVLSKAKEMPGLVTFDGDGDRYVQNDVATQEILLNDGDWRPSRYAHRDRAELQKIFDNTRYPIRTLGEFVDGSIVGTTVSRDDRRFLATKAGLGEELLPFVRVSDLLSKDVSQTFRVDDLRHWATLRKSRRIIDFPAVLVSKIGTNLKPTYFEYNGAPLVIGTDVVALRVKPNVNLRYFLAQLNSRLVQIQLEMVSSGNVIRRVSVNDLLKIKLPFPPIEEQDQMALELTALAFEKAKVLEQKKEAEVETKATEYNIVAAISHNLNQKLGSIENDFDTIFRFLKDKQESGEKLLFSELIRRVQPGEALDRIPTLAKISDRLRDNLDSVYGTLKSVEGILQKQHADVELTDIARFIRTEVKDRFESPMLQISLNAPKKAFHVPIDRLAFRDALDNLLNNAQKHGFIEKDRIYHVNFSISRHESETGITQLRIVYKNDGTPFPKGFSFDEYKRLAARAGRTKGSGIGGFYIARVIDLHGGEFNEIRDAFDVSEFPVQFEILLPTE